MKLEDQVCSLELAKRLKELDVKQESLFVWEYWNQKAYAVKYYPYASVPNKILAGGVQLYSAFTVAELGEMLPDSIASGKDYHGDHFARVCINSDMIFFAGSEANARAKCLIHLIENQYLPESFVKEILESKAQDKSLAEVFEVN